MMPSGMPVATVAIDGAVNAALLSIQILAVSDEELAKKLEVKGEEMGMSIRLQREDIFEAMHRV